MLAFLTGPVRSGKSRAALALALGSGRDVTIAVGARGDDPEMVRRIARHQAERPQGISVIETCGCADWPARVPADSCLLVDCLGTVLGGMVAPLVPGDAAVADAACEERAEACADSLVDALLAREGCTVIVSNEVGWGVVPPYPLGRLFRDVLARANRRFADAADAAWLVVDGRCLDLKQLPREVAWPE